MGPFAHRRIPEPWKLVECQEQFFAAHEYPNPVPGHIGDLNVRNASPSAADIILVILDQYFDRAQIALREGVAKVYP